jgi:3-oxoacyl-[acyl-carrier protein] reductase
VRQTPRVALVTGAARGLGLAIAERLGADGHRTILCDADADGAHRSAANLVSRGMESQAIGLDVANPDAVAAAIARTAELYGRLDILVNNAGIQGLQEGHRPLVEEMPVELWQRTLAVNLTGAFLMCRAAIPLMRKGRWGRVVNIASRAARMRTGIGNANYAASKAGLIGLSRVLAGEVGRDGITVNCIAPSRIKTDMTLAAKNSEEAFTANVRDTALGRLCVPGDVAASVAFLCSDDAAFITGAIIDVNGGSFMA